MRKCQFPFIAEASVLLPFEVSCGVSRCLPRAEYPPVPGFSPSLSAGGTRKITVFFPGLYALWMLDNVTRSPHVSDLKRLQRLADGENEESKDSTASPGSTGMDNKVDKFRRSHMSFMASIQPRSSVACANTGRSHVSFMASIQQTPVWAKAPGTSGLNTRRCSPSWPPAGAPGHPPG